MIETLNGRTRVSHTSGEVSAGFATIDGRRHVEHLTGSAVSLAGGTPDCVFPERSSEDLGDRGWLLPLERRIPGHPRWVTASEKRSAEALTSEAIL